MTFKKARLNKSAGVLDVQFNWIFAFMVGVVILAFFVTVGMHQQSSAKKRVSIETIKTFRSVFVSAATHVNMYYQIDIVPLAMKFRCDNGKAKFILRSSSETIAIPLFSQDYLEGSRFYVYSGQWFIPYLAGSYIYLSSENYFFYLIKPSSEDYVFEKVIENIPQEFPYATININNITSTEVQKERTYKLVFFNYNSDLNALNYGKFAKVKRLFILNIHPNYSKDSKGRIGYVEFYKYKANHIELIGNLTYLGYPLLIGTIFVTSPKDYYCVLTKSINDLRTINSIYQYRTEKMFKEFFEKIDEYDNYFVCSKIFQDANSTLTEISTILSTPITNPETTIPSILQSLFDKFKNLETLNDRAITNSCGSIY